MVLQRRQGVTRVIRIHPLGTMNCFKMLYHQLCQLDVDKRMSIHSIYVLSYWYILSHTYFLFIFILIYVNTFQLFLPLLKENLSNWQLHCHCQKFRNLNFPSSTFKVHLTAFGELTTPQKQLNEPCSRSLHLSSKLPPKAAASHHDRPVRGGQMHLEAEWDTER